MNAAKYWLSRSSRKNKMIYIDDIQHKTSSLLLLHWNSNVSNVRSSTHLLVLASVIIASPVLSQNTNPPFAVTPPVINVIDENNVSIITGKAEFSLPLLHLGSLDYTEAHTAGINALFLNDSNLGKVVSCISTFPNAGYSGTGECAVPSYSRSVQAIYGKSRSTFTFTNGAYVSSESSGETFIDNSNGFCTWTQKDGTKVVYYATYTDAPAVCVSSNIAKVLRPDGRIFEYFYAGGVSPTGQSAILSIAANDGYLLKYLYDGTPSAGAYRSVVAINRAFESCDPMGNSCSLSNAWPSATFSTQIKPVSISDDFPNANNYQHHIVTIVDQYLKRYVFETDSLHKIISYQPPGAEKALLTYTVCDVKTDPNPNDSLVPLQRCGVSDWNTYNPSDKSPALLSTVSNVVRNGAIYNYSHGQEIASYNSHVRWTHSVSDPRGTITATGNSTPGQEYQVGPIDKVTMRDGGRYEYQASKANPVIRYVLPNSAVVSYGYDSRNNLISVTQNSIYASVPPLVSRASFPENCSSLITCNKPDFTVDANLKRTDYTYDQQHGGVLAVTQPPVNGVRPQKRYTYAPRYAWYKDASGVMTKETRPIWVLVRESYCRTGAAAGVGCAIASDEVLTEYDYGPDTGPNNLILRGTAITADSKTLRTCYGHDRYGHIIWERSPNAGQLTCPSY